MIDPVAPRPTMKRIQYFAYGSNMSSARLRFRVPGAQAIGAATLAGHRLCFHKRSDKDGSGKCDAHFTGADNDQVIGVLFSIPETQLEDLHRHEGRGHGYNDHMVRIVTEEGGESEALTYRAAASHIVPSLTPFSWYWDFVASGAREHGLPESYIKTFIESIDRPEDPSRTRDAEERAKVARP